MNDYIEKELIILKFIKKKIVVDEKELYGKDIELPVPYAYDIYYTDKLYNYLINTDIDLNIIS